MAYSHYDRLSALDASFLAIETPSVHMHVGSVQIFPGEPLRAPDGSLDMERLRKLAEPALRRSGRFRQRLERIPFFGHPVWVDDPSFNLDYHLRQTSLPEPGDARQLKRLAGRIFSQKLDPHRPLWELWIVENLEGGRIAVITKIHHCMIDGIASVDLMAGFMQLSPEHSEEAPSGRWVPRPTPSPASLVSGELARRAALPGRVVGAGLRALLAPGRAIEEVRGAAGAVYEALTYALGSASSTPLNDDVGPHRRFDWTRMDLAAVRELGRRLGGTVNDVVLAIVAGAMRHFLERRGVVVDPLDFRAMLPVSVRSADERGHLGNRVAFLMARLPVEEADPRTRVERTIEATKHLKASSTVKGGELIEEISDWTTGALFAGLARLAARTRSYNMVVTNVPGPQVPVYLAGARMEEIYPLVPLFSNQALGIALFSYDGGLFWGFHGDWDALPDLHDLVELVQLELETLQKLDGRVAR
ncbi:MAG TPA: wax ester/triacylglycerol synthase family O-acyltransferase [Myxococcota bacterium]|nr:wax ester/triacylglycerol synthase family O-acyltransferase [Myxococcota bacterium]